MLRVGEAGGGDEGAFQRVGHALVAGDAAVMMGTTARGASNAKAKRELGWEPRYPSWRQGFAAAYAGRPDSRASERSEMVRREQHA